jgi:hypothetical protein
MGRFYSTVPVNGLQVSEAALDQLLLVLLSLIDHSENMLCKDFSCL